MADLARIGSPTPDLVRERASSTPDAELLRAAGRTWTCKEFLQDSLTAAAVMRRHAGSSGRVAVSLEASDRLPFLAVGSMLAGIDLVLLPAFPDAQELSQACGRLGCGSVLSDREPDHGQECILPIVEALDAPPPFDPPDGYAGSFTFLTSGTEGSPKFVTLEHWKFWEVIDAMQRTGALTHATDRTVFLTQPLFHSYGLCAFLEYLHAGATIVLPVSSNPLGPLGSLLRDPIAARVEAIEGVPFFWQQFARASEKLHLPALAHVGLGGGRAEASDLSAIVRRYPRVTVSVRYGLTETPSVATHKVHYPPHRGDWGSSGRPLPCFTVEIRNTDGSIVLPAEEGEIFVLSQLVHDMSGVLATGDLGRIDHNGELFVTGRRSAFLKRRGYRLSPEVIESAARRVPGVEDCRAVNNGEEVLLEVVCRDTLVGNDLIRQLRVLLPSYATPDRVRKVDRVPRTPSGKIKRG